jgi:hypothetical protein
VGGIISWVQHVGESRDPVMRRLEGFFTLAVEWVNRFRSGTKTDGVLTGDERTAGLQPAYFNTRCHYWPQVFLVYSKIPELL